MARAPEHLRLPAVLAVLVLGSCTRDASPAPSDAALAADDGSAGDGSANDGAPLDHPADGPARDGALEVAMQPPEDAGPCQNISFYLSTGCVNAVDYPDGAEMVDATNDACLPDPEPNCA